MNLKKELGEKIKRMRKKKNLTQEQLAEMIEISPRNLSGIESGSNFVKAETLEKIITALDSSLEEICSTEHLEETKTLLNKINVYLKNIEHDRRKIEYVYKMLKFLNE